MNGLFGVIPSRRDRHDGLSTQPEQMIWKELSNRSSGNAVEYMKEYNLGTYIGFSWEIIWDAFEYKIFREPYTQKTTIGFK